MASTTTTSSPSEEPSANVQSPSRKETYYKPTPEEWESVRLIIRELYIDQNKTLSEVSDTLDTVYGFHAS